MNLDLDKLLEYLHYEPETGEFWWKKKISTNTVVGRKIGFVSKLGYVQIGFARKIYLAHRLAWKMYYKEDPPQYIDHIDGNPSNNAIKNLRKATNAENVRNAKMRPNKKIKLKGAYYHPKLGKYFSSICVNYKQKYLGLFDTAEEAHAAYCKASAELHGEFGRSS